MTEKKMNLTDAELDEVTGGAFVRHNPKKPAASEQGTNSGSSANTANSANGTKTVTVADLLP